MSLPIFTIIGATGAQGSSVLNSALAAGHYKIRAITRNNTSEKATALKARGVEVVSADLNDESSLIKAFAGSTAIYAVTDFFEPFGKAGPEEAIKIEFQQGQNLANAALVTPTLKHYIWSTLPNGVKISGGKYLVPHFESKNKIDDYIRSKKALFEKTTFLWVTWYATNYQFPPFNPIFVPTAGKYIQIGPAPANTPVLTIGDARFNIGPFTNSILAQPALTYKKFILAYTEESTVVGLLETWAKATGKQAVYVEAKNLKEYDGVWPGWGQEMGVMMEFWGAAGDKSWSGEDILTAKELGVEAPKEGFVSAEEAYKSLSWE